ncbi:MAG: hypothetical protein R3B69_01715 [Candidatus Paceibacterota bacterium]
MDSLKMLPIYLLLEAGDLKDLPSFKERAAQNVVTAIASARKSLSTGS